jgi:hypothetical protein
MAGPASAAPRNAPAYVLNCGGTIYQVVSPDYAATGSDVNSTSQLVGVVGHVPKADCLLHGNAGRQRRYLSAYFLITPAG